MPSEKKRKEAKAKQAAWQAAHGEKSEKRQRGVMGQIEDLLKSDSVLGKYGSVVEQFTRGEQGDKLRAMVEGNHQSMTTLVQSITKVEQDLLQSTSEQEKLVDLFPVFTRRVSDISKNPAQLSMTSTAPDILLDENLLPYFVANMPAGTAYTPTNLEAYAPKAIKQLFADIQNVAKNMRKVTDAISDTNPIGTIIMQPKIECSRAEEMLSGAIDFLAGIQKELHKSAIKEPNDAEMQEIARLTEPSTIQSAINYPTASATKDSELVDGTIVLNKWINACNALSRQIKEYGKRMISVGL